MDITPQIPKGRQVLTGYGAGGFKINNEFVQGSVLIMPEASYDWTVDATAPFDAQTILPLLDKVKDIDILLIGTGANMGFFPADLREKLKAQKIAVDVMSTGAACRTYNVLLAEERRVAAMLMAV